MNTHQLYTLSGNAQAEKHIREYLEMITQSVLANMPQRAIRSLVLIGGYGKGEGGVRLIGEEYKPHNNFDLLLVTCDLSKRHREKLHTLLSAKLCIISSKIEMGIDLSVLDQHQLEKMPTRVLWYDMKQGHKTLFGDHLFISSINHLHRHIPAWDMRNLMVNRGSLLLINRVCLQTKERADSTNQLIIKHAMKAIIGYGDALLYFLGEYHWSYREKHKRLLKHPDIDLNFKRLYDEAMSFRLSPQYEYYLHRNIDQWHQQVMARLEKVHLRCESIRLGYSDLSWDEYMDVALRSSLFERGFSLKELARKLLNLTERKHGQLPKRLSTLNHLAYRLADKECILPIIFPYISFNPPVHSDKHQLARFFTSHFGKQTGEPLLNIVKAYLNNWGAAFDRNLNTVLSKNQITL